MCCYVIDGAVSVSTSNFVTGARIPVLLCTKTTQKIYRGGAEVDFISRSRLINNVIKKLRLS